jgi:multiple antibiotic resistance protein
MISELIQLTVLFFVIVDPFMSMGIFFAATNKLVPKERNKIAVIAVTVAVVLSALFLFFGEGVLSTLQIKLTDFQIAGGIILGLLGIQMVLGHAGQESDKFSANNAKAIAAVIGTPLLTGPATITTIIVSTAKYGLLLPAIALLIVFGITFLLLYFSPKVTKLLGPNITKVITTLLGLITLVYGVAYIKTGLGF